MAGFTATHIHSPRLAEVRSLVVGKEFRVLKLGKKLVEACLNEAKTYGIKEVLSLTYEKGFFESCGFREIAKEEIPEHHYTSPNYSKPNDSEQRRKNNQ